MGKGKNKGYALQAPETAVEVLLPNGALVGHFDVAAASTILELKKLISASEGNRSEKAPEFQVLLLSTDDPLHPRTLENNLTLTASGVVPGAQLTLVWLPCREPGIHRNQQHVPWVASPTAARPGQLPDLSQLLVENGDLDRYVAWREEYRRWREGKSKGAQGWVAEDHEEDENTAWRDSYRSWRLGKPRGASGETAAASAKPLELLKKQKTREVEKEPAHIAAAEKMDELPAVVFDVVAPQPKVPSLIPVDGPIVAAMPVDDFPADALVTIRVFRFFEDRSDEEQVWEQELQNVNSGSLLWVPVHLSPGLHSKSGAKYGTWFTIHYLQAFARHFRSAYHMANEGACFGAKTFGSTPAETSTVSGSSLANGYFWYVSPSTSQQSLGQQGWRHLCRAGPFDGKLFHEEWVKKGSSLEPRDLQKLLDTICNESCL